MRIDANKCIGCGTCLTSCPMAAISLNDDGIAVIDKARCVECNCCQRIICPTEAIEREALEWPEILVESLSNPTGVDEKSGVSGRGTAEMKTNDVTGRIRENHVGLCVEMGRPGVGTTFIDVEKVCMALAKHHVDFEPLNPVTYAMEDVALGTLKAEVRPLRVLSVIIEVLVPCEELEAVLVDCKKVAGEIDTVFSIGVSSLVRPDGSTYFDEALEHLGIPMYDSGKTNVGLGKPAYEFKMED